jgi:hypothetical protein
MASHESWLPASFEFLSGLPTPVRRRRLIVTFQCFVDDSGGVGHSRHFVLAGLIGSSAGWASFADEWRACLDEEPSIGTFKMREAANLRGEFLGWSKEARDDKLRALARIINRHPRILTYSVIDLDAHSETWRKRLTKPMNEVYFHPFHNTIMATCFTLWDAGWREPFEIIFDEQVIFGPRAKAWYPIIRAIVQHREPEAAQILPVEPMFRKDEDFLPLQAADLAAWCIRRATDDPTYKQFEWLLDEMKQLQGTDYSQYYDRERMESVWAQTEEILRGRTLPAEVVRAYRETFGK